MRENRDEFHKESCDKTTPPGGHVRPDGGVRGKVRRSLTSPGFIMLLTTVFKHSMISSYVAGSVRHFSFTFTNM